MEIEAKAAALFKHLKPSKIKNNRPNSKTNFNS